MEMMNKHKTMVSIVTLLGEGGIGKIIVSGHDALSIVNKVFQGKGIADLNQAASHKLYYGHVYDKGERIDEIILNVMRQEDSFTGEDVVEINCHGGIRVVMRIYELLQSSGAEGVEWDSLLQRSFENDKIDFIQKEAFQELIHARTKLGLKVLLDQYGGALSGALQQGLEIIEGIRQSLLVKNNENTPPLSPPLQGGGAGGFENEFNTSISVLTEHVRYSLETASFGVSLTTPQVLVILGKPNVGKSTLINAILGEDRMLVHHEPGTKRAYVSEFISIKGIPFELVDTAGVRETSDMLEVMSIEMTQEQLQRANKVIVVFANSRKFDQEDEGVLSALNFWQTTKSSGDLQQKANARAIIPVVNKCDLPAKLDKLRIEAALHQPVCRISALNKKGFEDLNKQLVQEFDTAYSPMKPVVFNKRQYLLLAKADALIKHKKDYLSANNVSDKTFQVLDELKDIFRACLEGTLN